ncbi:MAG: AAA family ATPase [Candidatus Shapirobacteria bacterium]|jgi:2-phosphoglycerate kinase
MKQANRIFIYGVPGSGKTTFSRHLAKQLGLPLVEADCWRKAAQKGKTKKENPFLFAGTTEAWEEFGALSEMTSIKGLRAVRRSLHPYVLGEMQKLKETVMEAAFLDPIKLSKEGTVILLTTEDENRHKKQYFRHWEKIMHRENFLAARFVQNYLLEEARIHGFKTIDNNGDLGIMGEKFRLRNRSLS